MSELSFDEEDLIDFHLAGVISSFSEPHQFIFHFNKTFHTSFKRIDDLDVWVENQIVLYAVYEWKDTFSKRIYHIIKNSAFVAEKSEQSINLADLFDASPLLIPQHKNYNYIVRIMGVEEEQHEIRLPFTQTYFIERVTLFDINTIKTRSRLIF